MFSALFLAFGQMGDPAFRRPLILGVLGAALVLALLAWAAIEAAGWAAGGSGWLSWVAATGGGIAALFLAWWLFLPAAVAIASQFIEPVAAAVERRHYPGLPPARGSSAAAQIAFGLGFGLKLLILQLVLLPLIFIPVVGMVLALAISAYALGAGMVVQTAMLRLDPRAAKAAWRARRRPGWGLGLALAGLAMVPLLNLVVPVIGTAAAVHLLRRPTTA